MNWVIFSVFVGLFSLNFLGLGLFHHKYRKQHSEKDYWKDDPEFWLFTILCLFVGASYVMLEGITTVKNLLTKKK